VNDPAASASLEGVWPLVGRDSLVARVTDAVLAHGSRMVVLTGEAGVGKSRIAAAAAQAAERAGDLVIALQGQPILAAVPLGVAGPLLPLGATPGDPVALLAAVRSHLAALAGDRRVVVDAQSAGILDPITTDLLAQLVAARAVTLLATIRTGDPLPDALIAQWSPDDCTRFEVPPLSRTEAGELLQTGLGGPVAWHVADQLHVASGGNPLYLRELVIGAVTAKRLTRVAGTWQLDGDAVATPALRDLALAHVRRLDDGERDLVERLAVCGRLAVDHLPGATTREALARLEETGLVTVSQEAGRLSAHLTQRQYGAVVREGLSTLRLADIARQQADRLEADGLPEDVLRIALWRLDAGVRVDHDALLAAAELAHLSHDHRTVERLTAAASDPHPANPRLNVLRGTALARLGRLADSLDALETAAAQAAGGDPAVVLQVAAATAFTHASFIDGTAAALAVLDAVPAPLAQSPAVALMRSTFLLYEHRVAEARRLLDEVAPAFTGSAVERGLYAHALAPVLSAQGEDEHALAVVTLALDEARSAAGSPHWPTPLPAVEVTRAEVLLQAGRLDEALASAIHALRLATASDDQFITRYIEFVVGRIEMEKGRLEAAARWFQEVAGGALTRGPESLVAPAAGALAMVRFAQGDDDAARAALALVPPGTPPRNPTTVIATSIGLARAGELTRARDLLVGRARELEELGFGYLAGLHLFALARFGDAANAAAALARLVANGAGGYTARQARHAAAEAQGDRAELIAVGDEWEAHGAVLYAAEAFASAARLAQAAGESRAAIGLQARADGLTASAQGAATPLLRFTAVLTPLTAREREIAELAARGASSKDIAERLFLSVRTVDNHLQSIYGKLGIRGRRELADAIG
jgi:DNA-binding CsgD family transcriptional regulator/tetratricopeptide (TPR) repeat protein